MFNDSAFLLLLGVILAGVIHRFINDKNISKLLKGSPGRVIMKASLIGVPLPLCSCSVLPVAYQLNRSGLGKGGTASFLISTPETGVDSIFLTYSLCDPVLTIARPVSAFVTAMGTGLLIDKVSEDTIPTQKELPADCCCCSESPQENTPLSFVGKIKGSFKYAFGDVLYDLAPYLLFGYLLAGIVDVLLGNYISELPSYLIDGWAGYLGAIMIGLPMYICATSSTPLAAVLLFAGFSPGAVLVFLLVGPATNVASLVSVNKIFKIKTTAVYLLSIIVISILCGLTLDYIYDLFDYMAYYNSESQIHDTSMIEIVSSIILIFFIIYYSAKKLLKKIS